MREATPAVHSPPDRPRPAGRGDHPADGPPDLFATVLASTAGPPPQAKAADTKARTAPAEGDQASCDSTGQTDSRTATPSTAAAPAAAVVDGTPTAPAAQAAVTALPTATTQDAPGQEASPAPAAQASPVRTTVSAAEPAAKQTDNPQAEPLQTAASAAQTAPATAPAVDDAAPQAAPATQPETTIADAAQPAPQGPAQPGATVTQAAAAGKHAATAGGQHEHQQGEQRQQPQPGTASEVTAASTRRTRRGTHRPQPIASTRTQQPMSSTPATAEGAAPASETGAPTHAAASAPAGRVRILELAESMRAVVSVANRRGSATARIMLRPDTLGGVQVKLRAGRDGVSAELIADSAHAAQALATAGADLRRALEAQGVNLLGLDVRTAGDGAEAHGHEGRRAAESEQRGAQGGMDAGEDPEITIESSRLPDPGSQVDVLA